MSALALRLSTGLADPDFSLQADNCLFPVSESPFSALGPAHGL